MTTDVRGRATALERQERFKELEPLVSRFWRDLWDICNARKRADRLSQAGFWYEELAAIVEEQPDLLDESALRPHPAPLWNGVARLCRVLEHVERCKGGGLPRDIELWPELEEIGSDQLDQLLQDGLQQGDRGRLVSALRDRVGALVSAESASAS